MSESRKSEGDWQPTGERRWRVTKRAAEYRTLRSEREEIDMDTGQRRWVPHPHGTESRINPAGTHMVPKYERTEQGGGSVGDVIPWT